MCVYISKHMYVCVVMIASRFNVALLTLLRDTVIITTLLSFTRNQL